VGDATCPGGRGRNSSIPTLPIGGGWVPLVWPGIVVGSPSIPERLTSLFPRRFSDLAVSCPGADSTALCDLLGMPPSGTPTNKYRLEGWFGKATAFTQRPTT